MKYYWYRNADCRIRRNATDEIGIFVEHIQGPDMVEYTKLISIRTMKIVVSKKSDIRSANSQEVTAFRVKYNKKST